MEDPDLPGAPPSASNMPLSDFFEDKNKPVRHAAGDTSPVPLVDIEYALWLASLACCSMAAISLLVDAAIFILGSTLIALGGTPWFSSETYLRLLALAAMFGSVGIAAQMIRRRLESIRRALIVVPLPYRIVANPIGSDTISKFEFSCKVSLVFDDEEPLGRLKLKSDALRSLLGNAFLVAVTDPSIRFSKQKIEQTLKVAALHVLGKGVNGALISDIRQRRVYLPPPAPANAAQDCAA